MSGSNTRVAPAHRRCGVRGSHTVLAAATPYSFMQTPNISLASSSASPARPHQATNDRPLPGPSSAWTLAVAPMLDWTDRHCRYFHRQLSRHARLYTEMVTTGALLHGDQSRHLDFSAEEQPLALQLGGSEPADLAACATLAHRWGYAEVNLNCGCPSERVQRGAFGACLMAEPALVRDGVAAMRDAVGDALPITVKHRIGIDQVESFGFVQDFVGTVAEAGCSVFIVHARNAWLQGLSPKDNREIPPLRHEFVYRLKREFPHLTIVINGGVKTDSQVAEHLRHVDGVMIGREAYQRPWWLASWDALYFGVQPPRATPDEVEDAMLGYAERMAGKGTPPFAVTRHMLNLWKGAPGARLWRQVLSDPALRGLPPADLFRQAKRARLAHNAPLAA
nr:tRNA dihydrouridine(20/20a) synthase DusA [Thiomonas sp. FB-Cd]